MTHVEENQTKARMKRLIDLIREMDDMQEQLDYVK